MPEARRCGQTQHLREKRRRALLILAPNDGVIEVDHNTSSRGLHQPALRDRRLDEGSEERMGREGFELRMELYAHKTGDGPSNSWDGERRLSGGFELGDRRGSPLSACFPCGPASTVPAAATP